MVSLKWCCLLVQSRLWDPIYCQLLDINNNCLQIFPSHLHEEFCTRRLNYNMLIVNQCGTGYFPSLGWAICLLKASAFHFRLAFSVFFFSFELTAVLALGNAIFLTQVFLYLPLCHSISETMPVSLFLKQWWIHSYSCVQLRWDALQKCSQNSCEQESSVPKCSWKEWHEMWGNVQESTQSRNRRN